MGRGGVVGLVVRDASSTNQTSRPEHHEINARQYNGAEMAVPQSFIPVDTGSHFSLQNLPYGVFSSRDNHARRVGVALGNQVGLAVSV